MRIIFIGPPGSGKGTQTKFLSQRLSLVHVGTGDILRTAIRDNSPAGQLAKPFLETGQLVPDDVVNQIIADLFNRPDRPERFVMDGYPRTLNQAKRFDDVLNGVGLDLQAVVVLVVPDQEIVRRLSGRWNCPTPSCKATYHMVSKPPKTPGVCDDCGAALIQRDDDKESTVRKRLQVFHEKNADLLAYYRAKGLVKEVPGVGDMETIYRSILAAMQPTNSPPANSSSNHAQGEASSEAKARKK